MGEIFSEADLRLALESIFDGGRRHDPLHVPIEQRVACAIAAARHGASRGVVWIQNKERADGHA